MSTPDNGANPPDETPPGPFVHYCMHEGCEEWGTYGFEARYGTVWYCLEHRAEGEAQLWRK